MMNSLGEGLIVINERGLIGRVNPYALKALGYQEAELIGQWFPKAIIAVDQNSQPLNQLDRPITRALTSGETVSDYLYYVHKHGHAVPVYVTVSPILIRDRPVGVIEVFRDLTQERQLDVAKDEFVSLASHQLRTPATGVMSILSMLASGDFGPLNERQKYYLDKALQTNGRQLQIIEGLLNAARVDAGKMQLDLEYVDLVPLVRDTVSDHASLLAAHDQTVELQLPDHCLLVADPHKLRMVMDNLINNAGKYSRSGTTIHVAVRHEHSQAFIAVQDEGVGIAEDDLPKLFTKFTRLPNELSSTTAGTGLGLFLARSIVELHHGRLTTRSKLGQGTTFTIELPVRRGGVTA